METNTNLTTTGWVADGGALPFTGAMPMPANTARLGANHGVTFNIETVARQQLEEDLRPDPEKFDVPATSKGIKLNTPELVRAWKEEKLRDMMNDFALSPLTNQICAIALKKDNSETICMSGTNERALLEFFLENIQVALGQDYWSKPIIGFNSIYFDMPILAIALAKNNMGDQLPLRNWMSKYSDSHLDVRSMLTLNDRSARGTLGDWCTVFGLPRPFGKGHMVANWFAGGDWESIERHCSENVDRTWDLFTKISMFKGIDMSGEFTSVGEASEERPIDF